VQELKEKKRWGRLQKAYSAIIKQHHQATVHLPCCAGAEREEALGQAAEGLFSSY
jgi:hypothetical protein